MIEYKDSEFGQIPVNWEIKTIKDVLKVKGRIGWKGYKTSDLRASGPVVIGGTNIKSQLNLDFSDITHLSREKFEESPEIQVKKGDVILVARGNGIGAVGMYKGEFSEATINPSVVILSNFNGINEYLVYFLLSPQGNGLIMSNEGGSSIPALYQGQLNKVQILLPPIEEQQSIASVLSSLDHKIDLLHRQNKTLEQMAETLFRQWFVEESTEASELAVLTDFATHIKNTTNPGRTPELIFNHYSLPAYDNGQKPELQVGREILSNKYNIEPGNILISKLNPRTPRVWFIYNCDKSSVCSTEFQVFSPIHKEYAEFIYCWLKSNDTRDILAGAASGTSGSHQRVSPDDICSLEIKRPDKQRIIDFNKICGDWIQKISNNQQQILVLEKLRDSLLPKLMNGTVRVVNN